MEKNTLSINEYPDFQLVIKEDGISLYYIPNESLQYVMPVKNWSPLQFEYAWPSVSIQYINVNGLQRSIFLTLLEYYGEIYVNLATAKMAPNWYYSMHDCNDLGHEVIKNDDHITYKYNYEMFNKN